MADRYWVGGTGTWSTTNTANWSTTSGGAGGASVPTAADSVFFDQAGTYAVTLPGAGSCLDFNVSAGAVTFAGFGLAISGNLAITNITPTWTAAGTITFNATSAKTITSNGTAFSCGLTFDGIGGSWALQGALTTASIRTVALVNGTLSLGSNTLTCGLFNSNTSNVRTIDFGTGAINLTGSGATIYTTNTLTNLTILPANGPRQVIASYSGSTGTRSFGTGSGLTESYAIDVSIVAGSDTVGLASARNIDFTGFSGTWSGSTRSVYGNLILSAAMTLAGATNPTTFASTSATPLTITCNGQTFAFPVNFNAPGAKYVLQDAFTMGSIRLLTLTNGTIDLNGKTLTAGASFATASGTKSITFNGGAIVCPASGSGGFNNSFPTNFTTSAGSAPGTISMTAASAKTFVGGGSAYAATLNQGGSGVLTVDGANTFADLTATVTPSTISLAANQTFSDFTLSGTGPAGVVTFNSTVPGTKRTISKTSGIVGTAYLAITDSDATGGASWYAPSTLGNTLSNTTGWIGNTTPMFPPAISATNVLYAAALSSRITVAPPRHNNTNTLYSAALSSRITLQAGLLTNSNTFYAATLRARNTLLPPRHTNANAFYAATISPGPVSLQPPVLPNNNTFYAARIAPGPVTLTAPRFDSVNVLYAPFLHAYTNLRPPLIASTTLFFPAVVSGGSPIPLPYHPWCQHEGMTVVEVPRQSFTITGLPRKPMSSPGC